ncbi:hypothetical protein KY290_007750 [Solanum tuberosum]|uniref:DUF4216 domain-containing protein n=1 Tax=Solanum tuberosum TaxID=4113 RepID=A0ABQ7W8F7_SOLTU|nr:hypothetical protein KY290_007750 [Solanum tuberosum]
MPELNIPPSYNKTKSMVKNLILDYEKIDACPNDCMLFRNDHKDDEFCHTCGASRYIKSPEVDSELEPSEKQHQVSVKTLRHFPLIPTLKRLIMCSKMADSLMWHEEERFKDGKLRHPVDGLAWKDFDRFHPDFVLDSRNVILGLSSDGFNPFQTMSIAHNIWPAMLMGLKHMMLQEIKLVKCGYLLCGKSMTFMHILCYLVGEQEESLLALVHNLLRHNLDVMHIEKNIVDSILGTLLDISGKTKNHAKARYDLKDMGIRKNLHPKDTEDTKLPDGSASNISSILPDHVAIPLIRLRRAGNNDECDPSDAETVSLFPNKGVPLGAKKIDQFILDNKSLSQAHAYLLGNCDEVQEYIRFHVRQCDAKSKTQNSGFTLVALTTSFASSKDKNPIAADLTYYGRIVEIVELDYYGYFKVVLFKCDWYEVENDTYGLTYVYFTKRCSQEEPFVLGYQVHQCFYVQDPYDQDRHYVMKTVPRDLFNMSNKVESNLPQSYENETSEHLMGPSIPKDNGEVLFTRTDVRETIIDVPSEEFVTQQLEVEYKEEFEDESADEFEDESENEYEDESENELEDESEEEFKDDAP